MDQYLSKDGDLLLGDAVNLPPLSMPPTPRSAVVDLVLQSSVSSPTGCLSSVGMRDLSIEGGTLSCTAGRAGVGCHSEGVEQFTRVPIAHDVI